MSGSLIKLGAFRDQESIFEITADDLFVPEGSKKPAVDIQKRSYKETCNRIELTWTNRAKNYAHSIVIANDEVDQRISGRVRKKSVKLLGIMTEPLAQKVVYRLLAESMYRFSSYSFILSYKKMRLEVGDVGTLSDGELISNKKIRLLSVNETEDGSHLEIEAVEDLPYLYFLTDYDSASNQRTEPDVITLTSPLVTFLERWDSNAIDLHICPQDIYCNGWAIYYSWDDLSYEYAGTASEDISISANAQGLLLTELPAHPSVIYKPKESFSVEDVPSFINLVGTSVDSFFQRQRLAKVGDEVIGYKDTLSLSGVWKISTLIRGLFNSEPVAHSIGESFSTLDTNLKFDFLPIDVGKTIYFKILTFYGDEIQQLDEVTSFSYTIQGVALRPLPIQLLHINNRDGHFDYNVDDINIDLHFASRIAGFGVGGYGSVLWGSFIPDGLIRFLEIEVRNLSDALISSKIIDLGVSANAEYQFQISAAERNSVDPVIVSVISGSTLQALFSKSIVINDWRS